MGSADRHVIPENGLDCLFELFLGLVIAALGQCEE